MPDITQVDGIDDDLELENTRIDDLETEEVNLMFIGIDQSSSMSPYHSIMVDELRKFKKSIIDSKENEKILVSRGDFDSNLNFRGYKKITEFDEDYQASGTTRLYDVIVEGTIKLTAYMELLRQQGVRVKAVFAIFSDGQDVSSYAAVHEARKYITELNQLEIVTVFISFGNEGLQEAKDLGFKNILEVGRTESELRKAFNQLSKSLISQSKSVTSKTDDFFEL